MISITQEMIMHNWKSKETLVSIRCVTYNQEKYISQALDSFLMQKTNFPFEIVVHDDASTDKTIEIIKEYEKKFPDIVKPIYETENQYSKKDNSLDLIILSHLKGKYTAYCEGDDFWTNKNKLQKQVDFLEQNPDYGFCCTDVDIYYEDKKKYQHAITKSKKNHLDFTNGLKSTGYFTTRNTSLDRENTNIKSSASAENTKVNAYQARLQAQFQAMENMISKMQSAYSSAMSQMGLS